MFLSPRHILYIAIPIVVTALLFLIFRKSSTKTKRVVVFALTVINVLQHLLKAYIYPQYAGESFGARSTVYNMCAFLILASPIIFLIGSELWQNFIFYIGSIAGLFSILSTYWLTISTQEQIRFVICHGLLFVSSFLPWLFGIYKVNYRKCWRLPFVFFMALGTLIVNDTILYALGMVDNSRNLYDVLSSSNPCWVMHPPSEYPIVEKLVAPFTPSVFLSSRGGVDTPILWYAFPLYILITSVGFILGAILDRKRFCSDIKALRERKYQP